MDRYLVLIRLTQGSRQIEPGNWIRLDKATADILIRKRGVLPEEALDTEELTSELARKMLTVCFAEDALRGAYKQYGITPSVARSLAVKHGPEWCARRGTARVFIGAVTAEDIKAWRDG